MVGWVQTLFRWVPLFRFLGARTPRAFVWIQVAVYSSVAVAGCSVPFPQFHTPRTVLSCSFPDGLVLYHSSHTLLVAHTWFGSTLSGSGHS